jgi:hypothetical protein
MRDLKVYLPMKSHMRSLSIDIEEHANLQDTALYARHRLQEVAEYGELTDDWPGSLLLKDFVMTTRGLFIWVFVVSEHLRNSANPDVKLEMLLSRSKARRA